MTIKQFFKGLINVVLVLIIFASFAVCCGTSKIKTDNKHNKFIRI